MQNHSLKTEVFLNPDPDIYGETIRIRGQVQGVGFRPTVWRLANEVGLLGRVLNDGEGVLIRAWGSIGIINEFLDRLQEEAPRLARVDSINRTALRGQIPPKDFSIVNSLKSPVQTRIVPDAATCSTCLEEITHPSNRRYKYPFTNCVHCGPRFSIIKSIPYDRARTTLAEFSMCDDCQAEYEDPGNRRFHAQPNACPKCGPHARLVDSESEMISGRDPIAEAATLLKQGFIVAIKGLGGYQLACRADDENVVAELRHRKNRSDKPFALMVRSLDDARQLGQIGPEEATLLTSTQSPIVLLRKREPSPVAHSMAPGQNTLGVMLPCTPLHHLLLNEVGEALVMTSGNFSDEPIAYRDEEALIRLKRIADYFLIHNRPIHIRVDDSVTRVFRGQELIIRRARGYVPSPIVMPKPFARPVLACGGHFKNAFCLVKDRHAFMSHHIGDLENHETLTSFKEGVEHFKALLEFQPEVVAHDLHPDYLSTQFASQLNGVETIGVQHHHAHIASGMAEHGFINESAIGVAFDGTGYGTDGAIWGGEFLIASYRDFVRGAHLEYFPLPGGDAAIREPWRSGAACLHLAYGDAMEKLNIDFVKRIDHKRWRVLKQMIHKKLNCPFTSSMGRLFDAVASLLGIRDTITYDGQAAIELEQIADENCTEGYSWDEVTGDAPRVIGIQKLIRAVVGDIQSGVPAPIISARFHNSVAAITVSVCTRIRQETGLQKVVLGGGVFQNTFLLTRLTSQLETCGFQWYLPGQVPANDGGIALGQAAIANARIQCY